MEFIKEKQQVYNDVPTYGNKSFFDRVVLRNDWLNELMVKMTGWQQNVISSADIEQNMIR